MNYLILILVVAGVLWWMRSQRRADLPPAPPAAPPTATLQNEDMVACARCGVHLPRSEALPGRGGVFCGEAHRRAFEQEHSSP